jgi:hypothetical protein
MPEYSPIRFTITFTDQLEMELLDSFVENGFLGYGDVCRLDSPRVMCLRPYRSSQYLAVKSTLDELRDGGALTYVEDRG